MKVEINPLWNKTLSRLQVPEVVRVAFKISVFEFEVVFEKRVFQTYASNFEF